MSYKIYYIAGLPRSGSTLLTNILSQNPDFHVTPTNNLLALLLNVKNSWAEMESFKAQGLVKIQDRIRSVLKYMLHGFYERDIEDGKIIFDKSRGWLNNIELLEEITGEKVQIITTVRDVKDICTSFEKLSRKNTLIRNKIYSNELAQMNTYSRTNDLLSLKGVIGASISSLRDVYQRELDDRLFIIPFNNLTSDPKNTLIQLHQKLGLDSFEYDFKNVENLTKENDLVYGLDGLHTTDKVVKPIESQAAKILGLDLCTELNDKFNDINKLNQI